MENLSAGEQMLTVHELKKTFSVSENLTGIEQLLKTYGYEKKMFVKIRDIGKRKTASTIISKNGKERVIVLIK